MIIARTQDGSSFPEAGLSMDLDVWDSASPTTIVISLQFNPDDGTDPVVIKDAAATTSATGAWETVNFDFSGIGGTEFNQMVILFDPGNFTSDQYYFDNLQVGPIGKHF